MSARAADVDAPTTLGTTNNAATATSPAANTVIVRTNPPGPMVQAPATVEPPQTFQFPKLSLPPLLDQVVRLNQSGADETVVRAYIEKAAPPYQITGNEIIQLQNLGVSKAVILALIDHSKSVSSATSASPAPGAPPVIPQPSSTNEAAIGSAEAAADFYEPLSPYGAWMDVPGYGYCWQPTVVVVNPAWRPYCDYGDWRWGDSGWYWNSYYSWGWAPFHYGRWFSHPGRGWLWCPDRVWGPSWVSWRSSATHCGWAPLPPGACFVAGRGWTFRGLSVGVDFSFGLGAAHFTFVGHDRFAERHVGAHALRGDAGSAHYRNTSVINNYSIGQNNRIVNHGVGRERIASSSATPIRGITANEPARVGGRIVAPTTTGPNGFARAAQQNPGLRVASIQPLAGRMASGARSQPGLQATPRFDQRFVSRGSVAGGGLSPRSVPNYSQSFGNRAQIAQPTYQTRAYASSGGASRMPARSFSPSMGHVQRSAGFQSAGRSMSFASRGGSASGRGFSARR